MNDQALDLKIRQLALLVAMDDARDSIDDNGSPIGMFDKLVSVLKTYFNADACGVYLQDMQTGDTEIIITQAMPRDMVGELAREALHFKKPTALSSSLWKHTLGLRIYIEREQQTVGAIILARNNEAFQDQDIELLELAERQIDSAVIQARTILRLADRNRELEVIYQIDRLRDDSADEETLYLSFTSLLMRHFQAELCLFAVQDPLTGGYRVRSIIDKRELSGKTLERLMFAAKDIQTITKLELPDGGIPSLNILAAPFIVSGERLGSVIIGKGKSLTVADTRLLVAATSQMDSAIAKSRTALKLIEHSRELEAIYRIDKIRDKESDFDEMLQQVLVELCSTVSSETGYLMLYNAEKEDPLEIRAATREGVLTNDEYMEIVRRVSREALDTESVITYNQIGETVRSIISIPLILNTQIIGVFGAINAVNPRGFTASDGRILRAITSQVDTAVFERLERRRMRKVLGRSVDPKVLDALLKRADDSLLAGERVVLTVLFADLRNSTEWAEHTDPEDLVSMLNVFLGMMTDVIFKHGGTLDKFVGDEVIALFGSPITMPDHAHHATLAGLEMQAVHQRIQAEFKEKGKFIPPMGVGISSGEVITGEFGPPIRTDFTAMGRVMNLGSRLCGAAHGNQILISDDTYKMLEDEIEAKQLEPISLKGIQRVVIPYELIKIK